MEKKLLIITPGRNYEHPSFGCSFNLLVAETGEHLASHFCSNHYYAHGDLWQHRPERIEVYDKRWGKGNWEVKFINETNITNEELQIRNFNWFKTQKIEAVQEWVESSDDKTGWISHGWTAEGNRFDFDERIFEIEKVLDEDKFGHVTRALFKVRDDYGNE